jgi:DNA modification methylase
MQRNKVYVGNNIDVLKTFPDNSIDSIVTDPPYGLGKEPDAIALLQDWITTGYHEVKGKGFMGKEWDAFVPQPIFWKECYRVLKHGGHVLSFAGTRTYDWMVIGLRLAGFEIRDQLAWIYGSGFPKSHDISKAIDKRNGEPDRLQKFTAYMRTTGLTAKQLNDITHTNMGSHYLTNASQPAIPTVALWKLIRPHIENIPQWVDELVDRIEAEREVIGKHETDMGGLGGERLGQKGGDITAPSTDQAKQWQGWGTALKPALEPIVMARKPLDGTVADNVLKHGVGGINIDGCRVGDEVIPEHISGDTSLMGGLKEDNTNGGYISKQHTGRFPANVIHDGSDEVVALFPDTNSSSGIKTKSTSNIYGGNSYHTSKTVGTDEISGYDDSGSASRFFYTAKASQTERNWGLDGFESDVTTDGRNKPIDNAFNRGETQRKNIHPTVKPIDLMRYLVRLVTPKGGVCLDPFLGSGTTAVACKSEKFDYIGIELSQEYVDIAEARIKAEVVQYDIFDILED